MKSIISIILILFCLPSAFSEQKTTDDLKLKQELKDLEKEIFQLQVDEKIDTIANYKLLFTERGNWSETFGSKQFKKHTYSRGNRIKNLTCSKAKKTQILS